MRYYNPDVAIRLIREKEDLNEKILKLENFKREHGDEFEAEEKELLTKQWLFMKDYMLVLTQRLNYYNRLECERWMEERRKYSGLEEKQ